MTRKKTGRTRWFRKQPLTDEERFNKAVRKELLAQKKKQKRKNARRQPWLTRARLFRYWRRIYDVATMPLALCFLTFSRNVHPDYGMNWPRRMWLGFRIFRNFFRIRSLTAWRAHLVIVMRILEIPPDVEGDVVECGCFKGGATVNLSLVCARVGRKLHVYDTFDGLPPPKKGDRVAQRIMGRHYYPNVYRGPLEEVRENVRRLGNIDACEFHRGVFEETLPHHDRPIALAYFDVDYEASLHDCLINLWPHVVDGGYVYMDEFRNVSYCAVFFSEKYWSKYFNSDPPGLIGIGTGVQVGNFYTDPSGQTGGPPLQRPHSTAFTRKGNTAVWNYYPDELENSPAVGHEPQDCNRGIQDA